MKITIGPYTGTYSSSASHVGEIGVQVDPTLGNDIDFTEYRGGNHPWVVGIGLLILVPFVICGIIFT